MEAGFHEPSAREHRQIMRSAYGQIIASFFVRYGVFVLIFLCISSFYPIILPVVILLMVGVNALYIDKAIKMKKKDYKLTRATVSELKLQGIKSLAFDGKFELENGIVFDCEVDLFSRLFIRIGQSYEIVEYGPVWKLELHHKEIYFLK